MGQNDSYVAEGNVITIAKMYVTAHSAPAALDRALTRLDRLANSTGRIASIETYTIKKVGDDRYEIDFA